MQSDRSAPDVGPHPPADPPASATPELSSQSPPTESAAPSPGRPRVSSKLLLVSTSALSQLLRIGTMFLLARLVPKNDHGLYALILALPGLLIGMGDFGASILVSQARDIPREEADDTALTMVIWISVIYTLIFLAGGVFLSWQQSDWRCLPVAAMAAVSSCLGLLYGVQLNQLNRDFRYGAEAVQNLVFSVSSCLTAIVFALLGFGVFALAGQVLASQLIANTAALRRGHLRRPRNASWRAFRQAFSLSWAISASAWLASVESRTLALVTAKLGGPQLIAEWDKAVVVQNLFSQNLNIGVERVVYPNLTASAAAPEKFDPVFRRGVEVLLLLNCGLAAWLAANARDIVAIALGPDWTGVTPLLTIVAFGIPAGAFYSLGYIGSLATGKSTNMLWWNIPRVIVMGVLALAVVSSAVEVAYAATAAKLLFSVLLFITVMLMMKVRRGVLLQSLLPIPLCGLGALAAMHYTLPHLSALSSIPRLALSTALGLSVYIGLAFLLCRQTLRFVASASFRK